ncbi:MAG: pyridoxamine 5'-phosphate oxidase family protein, partial [Bacteroidota bacterium]
SFIDILMQKGFQMKGTASIVKKGDAHFSRMEQALLELTEGKFPFSSITEITVEQAKPIIAPRYLLYPETTEAEQIAAAREAYGL